MSSWGTKPTGIYMFLNTVNGKVYVGSSRACSRRICQHRCYLKSSTHINEHLQAAWNKYGSEAFQTSIIEELPETCSERELVACEEKWIKHYKASDREYGYNVIAEPTRPLAAQFSGGMRGKHHSQETKEKIRKSHEGVKLEMTSARISANAKRKGVPLSEETKRKMSEVRKGRKFSADTLAKRSGENHWTKRKWPNGMPEEVKKKIRETKKRNPKPSAFKGHKHTPESIEKMKLALKGRTPWNKKV